MGTVGAAVGEADDRDDAYGVRSSGAVAGRDMSITGRVAAGRDVIINAPLFREERPAPFMAPVDIADFVDRTAEFEELAALFDRAGQAETTTLAALYGPGGVGKSALAVRLAHRLRQRFPDGILYALLGPGSRYGSDLSAALADFLVLLGRPAEPSSETRLVSEFRTTVADRRVLVVLDNARDAEQVRPLLPVSAGSGAIVTSRSPLTGLEGAELLRVPVLPAQDSARLLARLARVTLDQATAGQAAEVARMCGQLPLAIRIAGAKLRTRPDWDLATLAHRMADETGRLDILQIGDLEVRATLLTSYEDRDPDEQRALRALAVTGGDEFPSWVLAPILQLGYDESERLIDRLVFAQLVVVSRTDDLGETLYQMHDLVRAMARELLESAESPDERAAMGVRLNARYLGLVELAAAALREQGSGGRIAAAGGSVASPEGGPVAPAAGGDGDGFARLRALIAREPARWFAANRDGIIASLRRVATADGDLAQVNRFSQAMLALLILTPFSEDRIQVHRMVVEASRHAGDRAALAAALRDLGRAYRDFGRYPPAATHLEEAIALYEDLGDREELAGARMLYAVLLRSVGRIDEARQVTLDGLAHFEATGDLGWQAYGHRTLGLIFHEQARWADCDAAFARAIELFEAVGDRHREAICLVHRGSALRMRGEPARALPDYARAKETFASLGFPLWESITLVHRAAALLDLGVPDEARTLLAGCLATLSAIGDLRWVDITQYHQARLELRAGDPAVAMVALERAVERFRELDEPYSEALALLTLGEAQLAVGRRVAAAQTLARTTELAARLGNPALARRAEQILGSG